MTMIELLVAIAIVAIAITIGAVALGGVSSAKTREGAGKLATAVRYTYHLATTNNKTYALFLNLDDNTYHAAAIPTAGECDRVLLHLDGKVKDDVVISKMSDEGGAAKARRREVGKDKPVDPFGGIASGGEDSDDGTPPTLLQDDTSPAARLHQMIGGEARASGRATSRKAGVKLEEDEGAPKKDEKKKHQRTNILGKAVKLPDKVKFAGVILKEGAEPVTHGTVPIVVYPHGVVQRALILLTGGKDGTEKFTVEVMSLQARGVVHDTHLTAKNFPEFVE